MSKVDDELTRRLRGTQRPVDVDELFESLERRRSHRERVRRIQIGVLGFIVLATTAAGFAALRSLFDESSSNVGDPPSLPRNGDIVFTRSFPDGSRHLFAVRPGSPDERRITPEGSASYAEPAISPDGQTIVASHSIPSFDGAFPSGPAVLATLPIEGGSPTWLTEPGIVHDPAWSPDGRSIVFDGAVPGSADGIHVLDVATGAVRLVLRSSGPFMADAPAWSADGSRIVLTGYDHDAGEEPDLYAVERDGSGSTQLTETPAIAERSPAPSPDGMRIAFLRTGDEGHEIWTVHLDGSDEQLVALAVEASLEPDLTWAPDGTALLVSDGEWIYRVDATPDGDPRDNFVQLVRGVSPTWQPIPAGSEPPVTASPELSVSPSPETQGRDIGLGFPLCHVESLTGIDWYGDGTDGAAWTGTRVTPGGRCPEEGTGDFVVAADIDGDDVAEPGGMGFLSSCLFCRPYATTDLDADGVLELVVLEEATSTPSYSIYEVSVPTSERSPGIYNLSVAPPGHPEAGIRPGSPLRISTGGDEGFAGWVGCDGRNGELVLQVTWRDHPVEGGIQEVHETDLVLQHGIFVVVAGRDYELPTGVPVPRASDEPACGVDWQI